MDLNEDEFINECFKDIAEGHKEQGRTASELLGMLHPLERGDIAKRLLSLGVIKVEGRKMFRKIYVWA